MPQLNFIGGQIVEFVLGRQTQTLENYVVGYEVKNEIILLKPNTLGRDL